MASVTSRYARAFADVVLARSLPVPEVRGELESLSVLLRSSGDLRRIWGSPAVPIAQKVKLLDSLASRLGLSRPVRNFAAVLIEHRRIASLERIIRQFEVELNQRLGIAQAEVTSARELAADERQALESRIAHLTGKKVDARYAIDAALLGGAVVRLGSTVYDGSVRGQLNRIKEELAAS